MTSKCHISKIHVVGMYHYSGTNQLSVGAGYELCLDPHNEYDTNAVRVVERANTSKTVAYISRFDCPIICRIFDASIAKNHKIVLKIKAATKKIGKIPTQLCNIGFYIENVKKDMLVDMMKNKPYEVKFIDI